MPNIYFQVLKHHADSIQRLYGVRWVPQPHHFKLCKQLMQSEVEGFDPYTPEEIIERLEAYYKESWWSTVRHDFSNFCKHFDKFIVKESQSAKRIGETFRLSEFEGPKILCRTCGKAHGAFDDCHLQVNE